MFSPEMLAVTASTFVGLLGILFIAGGRFRRLSGWRGTGWRAMFTPRRDGPASVVPSGEVATQPPPGTEPRLPVEVVVGCRWHESYFHGSAGSDRMPLTVRGATVRGGMHRATETEGQDAAGAAWNKRTGTLYVAVADGLGSLPHSGRMADEAVRAALYLCMNKPDDLRFDAAGDRFFGAVAGGLRRSFGEGAADGGGTTLVVAEVTADGDGALVTVHGIGDSEAWLHGEQGWSVLHHESDASGADARNMTRDLPTDTRPRTGRYRLRPGGLLLLATDGFAATFRDAGPAWAGRLADRWRRPPDALDFVRVVASVGGELSDDRGVVAVWLGDR